MSNRAIRLSISFVVAVVVAAAGLGSDAGDAAAASRFKYVFPVVGHAGYARRHHDYPATDIIADCGLRVVSAVDGVVLQVSRVDLFNQGIRNGSTRGGKFVTIRGDDGVRYYGSHMLSVARGIKPGTRVSAGQKLGRVGQTGRAGVCHLHFGISPVCAGTGEWWLRRGVVWPWPYLDSWRKSDPSKHLSPRPEVRRWREANGCPSKEETLAN